MCVCVCVGVGRECVVNITIKFVCVCVRYGTFIDLEEKTFNAGVYGVNLDMWRKRSIHDEVLYWLDQVSVYMRG